jgi:hypothetical protein
LTNGEYNDIMPEEQDLEEYLAEIRNKLKQYNIWDDTWMIGETDEGTSEPGIPPTES